MGNINDYLSRNNRTIPYPRNNAGWDEFTAFAAQFYNNTDIAPKAQQIFKDHIKAVVTRKNTVNGRVYSEDPTVMCKLTTEDFWKEGFG